MPSNEKILLHRFLEHFRLPLVLVSLLLSDENNLRKLIVRCKDPWKYHNEKHNQLIYQGWRQSHQGQHPTYHHRQGSTDRPVYGLTGPNRSANFRRFLVPARSEIWNFSGSRFQFSPVRFGHVYPDPIFWIHCPSKSYFWKMYLIFVQIDKRFRGRSQTVDPWSQVYFPM